MKKVLKNPLNLILSIVLLLAIIGILIGIRPMVIMSGSMEPELSTGSLCFVNTKASFGKVEEGDIITYKLLEGKVTHRAVEITDKGIITKGDANRVNDLGAVTEDTFYGKVFFNIPYAGYCLHFVKRNLVAFILIILGLILMPWKKIFPR